MASGYLHVEVETAQSPKRPGMPCGDVVACDREPQGATIVCADGIGSGIKAHIAARMCTTRLIELLHQGFSLRRAFSSLVETMEEARDPAKPWAAFSIARIRNDGMTTVLCYEAPGPLLVGPEQATVLPAHPMQLGGALVSESHCHLVPGEGLMLVSDGITQAGMGCGLVHGWQLQGVAAFVSDRIAERVPARSIPHLVHAEARRYCVRGGDDCTAILARTKLGFRVNVLTGPPADRSKDQQLVSAFMQAEGLKIVCGGTTASILARILGRRLDVDQHSTSLVAPPRYEIEGIDLVTEGAVTLNQVYNVLAEDITALKEDSGVTDLCAFLNVADRVHFFVGSAVNDASNDVTFRQRGILRRHQIVPLLGERLRSAGKLVIVDHW